MQYVHNLLRVIGPFVSQCLLICHDCQLFHFSPAPSLLQSKRIHNRLEDVLLLYQHCAFLPCRSSYMQPCVTGAHVLLATEYLACVPDVLGLHVELPTYYAAHRICYCTQLFPHCGNDKEERDIDMPPVWVCNTSMACSKEVFEDGEFKSSPSEVNLERMSLMTCIFREKASNVRENSRPTKTNKTSFPLEFDRFQKRHTKSSFRCGICACCVPSRA